MSCHGPRAWGAKRWIAARVGLALLSALSALACGEGDGRKKTLECQVAEDCDTSELGICDTVDCEAGQCVVSQLPDGERCDDADPLTGKDACLSGGCAGSSKTC